MLILHQIKLMTSNGFGMQLIIVEKGLRGMWRKTLESLHEPPVGFERTNGLK